MELNRRLAIIDSQLRRSELTRKHLEISNKKLLGFAQVNTNHIFWLKGIILSSFPHPVISVSLLNTKENFGKQTVNGSQWLPVFFPYYRRQWLPSTAQFSLKYHLLCTLVFTECPQSSHQCQLIWDWKWVCFSRQTLKVVVSHSVRDHDLPSSSYRCAQVSPVTDRPDTPSPIPDPACQLAAEAKELVDGVCSLCTEDHSKWEMCTIISSGLLFWVAA